MIRLPTDLDTARSSPGTYRAGGTDLTELRRRGLSTGDVVDLRDVPGLVALERTADGGFRLGAALPVQRVADDPALGERCPGFVQAFGGLATPQIRARATVAGSLLQQVRCWYFRSATFDCLKKGGAACFARSGDARYHSFYDLGFCIAPHPSTTMLAVLAFDGLLDVDGELRDAPTVLGDGVDARATHTLAPGELVRAVVVPPPPDGERSGYLRTIHRARAEWPLVEVVVRLSLSADGALDRLVLAAGGVANRPLRFDEVAASCLGLRPDDPELDARLEGLLKGGGTIEQTAWKRSLIPATFADAIRRVAS